MLPLSRGIGPLGRGHANAAAFVPTDVAGLKLWLKADAGLFQLSNGTTPATADGDPVGYWTDQSSLGNHPTQATSGLRSLLKTAQVNSRSIVRSDGTDDYYNLPSIALSGDFTVWWVAKLNSAASRVYYGAATPGFIRQNSDTVLDMRNDASTLVNMTHAAIGTSAYALIEIVRAGSTVTRYKNGTADGSLTLSGTITFNEFFKRAAGNFASLDMPETGIYDSALSAGNRSSLEGYLNTRYAIY